MIRVPHRRNPHREVRLLVLMHDPADIIRAATVHWTGDVAKGHGTIATGSGKVTADYSFGTRFAAEPGTNPEELLGAALASCFTMAIAAALTRAGHPPVSVDTTANVHLHRHDGGVTIPSIALTAVVVAAGISDDEFQKLATGAKESCPVGKALQAVPTTLNASLTT
jgi:osmotically inducible protein OsmC